jgi:hypothetical protein
LGLLRANRIHVGLFIVAAAAFLLGSWHLMVLRFERGDVYPVYSSLRSDPLGTRAFYDSLDSLDDMQVARNMQPLALLKADGNATLFIIGASLFETDVLLEDEAEALEAFMAAGGRVVVTLMPKTVIADDSGNPEPKSGDGPRDEGSPYSTESAEPDAVNDKSKQAGKGQSNPQPSAGSQPEGESVERSNYTTLKERWGIVAGGELKRDNAPDRTTYGHAVAVIGGLPREVSWHSKVYFDQLSPEWNTLYSVDSRPVMVERSVGKGSLVMATDSFFVSNEALKSERLPTLLIHLIGRHTYIIIDETHHGMRLQHGVMAYLRRHRLHWVLVAMLAVAGLFIWRNALPLVPPQRQPDGETMPTAVPAHNATRGLTSLLQRNIPSDQLLKICFEQWEKTFDKSLRFTPAKRKRARGVIEQSGSRSVTKQDPVGGYRSI